MPEAIVAVGSSLEIWGAALTNAIQSHVKKRILFLGCHTKDMMKKVDAGYIQLMRYPEECDLHIYRDRDQQFDSF